MLTDAVAIGTGTCEGLPTLGVGTMTGRLGFTTERLGTTEMLGTTIGTLGVTTEMVGTAGMLDTTTGTLGLTIGALVGTRETLE